LAMSMFGSSSLIGPLALRIDIALFRACRLLSFKTALFLIGISFWRLSSSVFFGCIILKVS